MLCPEFAKQIVAVLRRGVEELRIGNLEAATDLIDTCTCIPAMWSRRTGISGEM
jgi:hypothetical protein